LFPPTFSIAFIQISILERIFMRTRKLALCAALAAAISPLHAQSTSPTAYTITQAVMGGGTSTIYRSGSKALVETRVPQSHTITLYDLSAKASWTWNPDDKSIPCSVGNFGGDSGAWGDPFAMTDEVTGGIAKGELKPAGTETIAGIPAQIYTGTGDQASTKIWFDAKDKLALRIQAAMPGGASLMMADIRTVSFAPPTASLFALPAGCSGVKPPPTAADIIRDETGDDPANYVNGMYGPGSKNSCSIVLKVVQAGTLAPITQRTQVAIDTSFNQNNPPHYMYGVGQDGTMTYSGGNIREITNLMHSGTARLGLPPAYFNLDVNIVRPGHAGWDGQVYRQCFAPTQVLLYVVKDFNQPTEGVDLLWVKSGKYATP
jgi:hypothetical protein